MNGSKVVCSHSRLASFIPGLLWGSRAEFFDGRPASLWTRPERREHMDAPTLSDLEIATIRIVQEDLPNVERPFAAQARDSYTTSDAG